MQALPTGGWVDGLAEWRDGDTIHLSVAFTWRLNDAYMRESETPEPRETTTPHKHEWSVWKIIGHTGDWFHPHIVQRTCPCGATETDDQ